MNKYYMTKYALSSGIEILSGQITDDGHLSAKDRYGLFFKGEFYSDINEAFANAEGRRVKKIASLNKQIKKLENMEFNESNLK